MRCLIIEGSTPLASPPAIDSSGVEVRSARRPGSASPSVDSERSANPFGADHESTDHIAWARWPDVVVWVGADAHDVARLALGLAKDFRDLVTLVTRARVHVLTRIDADLAAHPAVQTNLKSLSDRGLVVVPLGPTLALRTLST